MMMGETCGAVCGCVSGNVVQNSPTYSRTHLPTYFPWKTLKLQTSIASLLVPGERLNQERLCYKLNTEIFDIPSRARIFSTLIRNECGESPVHFMMTLAVRLKEAIRVN